MDITSLYENYLWFVGISRILFICAFHVSRLYLGNILYLLLRGFPPNSDKMFFFWAALFRRKREEIVKELQKVEYIVFMWEFFLD